MSKNKRKNSSVIEAKTERQEQLINAVYQNQMTIMTGFSGTGKTFLSASLAANSLMRGRINKIVLTRPNVGSGPSLGFRPGDMYDKMSEWLVEIFNVLAQNIGMETLKQEMEFGTIETVPFESMRGRSFDNAFVILDEAQNVTSHEMKMFVTRIGDAKVIVNGDLLQSDLNKKKSGLSTLVDIVYTYDMNIPVIDFKEEDIVRGGLCKEFIVNFMDYEK